MVLLLQLVLGNKNGYLFFSFYFSPAAYWYGYETEKADPPVPIRKLAALIACLGAYGLGIYNIVDEWGLFIALLPPFVMVGFVDLVISFFN